MTDARDADVRDDQRAGQRLTRRQHERQLRRGERHRHRRVHGRPDRLRRVRRQPARQVDRHDRRRRRVQVVDDRLVRGRTSGAFRPVPNERVHDQIGIRATSAPCSSQAPASAISMTSMPSARRISRFVAGVALESGRLADQHDRDGDVALEQRARDDESVAAVVAAAADHRDPHRRQRFERRFHGGDDLPAGVLHQHDRRQADLLDGPGDRLPASAAVLSTRIVNRAYRLC